MNVGTVNVYDDWLSIVHTIAGLLTGYFLWLHMYDYAVAALAVFLAYELLKGDKAEDQAGNYVEFLVGVLLMALLAALGISD